MLPAACSSLMETSTCMKIISIIIICLAEISPYRVCSTSKDSTIRVWELDSGQELCSELTSGSGPLTGLISPQEGV